MGCRGRVMGENLRSFFIVPVKYASHTFCRFASSDTVLPSSIAIYLSSNQVCFCIWISGVPPAWETEGISDVQMIEGCIIMVNAVHVSTK